MIISGVARSDSIDILQPANLTPEMILEMEEEFTLLRNAFTKALIEDEQIAFLTKQWYISVLARIRINAFRIELAGGGSYEDLLSSAFASVEAEAAVGNAVYILPSFYNHDCDPNAHIIWIDSAVAKLKTLRDIDEGEELRICYIDTSMDRDARRELLFRGFGFHCNCSRTVLLYDARVFHLKESISTGGILIYQVASCFRKAGLLNTALFGNVECKDEDLESIEQRAIEVLKHTD
ncbi:histone-lysine N-methyltransferase ATXR4-like protein [Trifolium pratense]|uniref:Histone-lysine N-methyltransferase ATXR4-like protein n=1 Tax=Trifolium pratense TaxID=57577 RepID=A0A2K3P286_TRIPR|nr:histone-lysine N-methyltransferase ATXR4-like protein [Trifolium pratense]